MKDERLDGADNGRHECSSAGMAYWWLTDSVALSIEKA